MKPWEDDVCPWVLAFLAWDQCSALGHYHGVIIRWFGEDALSPWHRTVIQSKSLGIWGVEDMALMCAPLSGLQLQHSLADVPVWTGQPLWRKQLLPINSSCFFPKELFNYLKSFSWMDNLLPFKEKKKKNPNNSKLLWSLAVRTASTEGNVACLRSPNREALVPHLCEGRWVQT